jgi:hypothetical protein
LAVDGEDRRERALECLLRVLDDYY